MLDQGLFDGVCLASMCRKNLFSMCYIYKRSIRKVQGVAPPSSVTEWTPLTGPLWDASWTLLRSRTLPCRDWLSRFCDPPCRDWLSNRTALLCWSCSWRRDALMWGRRSSSAPRKLQDVYLQWEMNTTQSRSAVSAALIYILFAFTLYMKWCHWACVTPLHCSTVTVMHFEHKSIMEHIRKMTVLSIYIFPWET